MPMPEPPRMLVALAMIPIALLLVAFSIENQDVVRTERVELLDPKGRIQATLAADTSGVILTLIDKNGRVTASFRFDDAPRLTVRDEAGREEAAIGTPRVQHLAQ